MRRPIRDLFPHSPHSPFRQQIKQAWFVVVDDDGDDDDDNDGDERQSSMFC
jgi:hypothetical protein